jgi:maltose alpha-D-glucosyltransferase/alpha-amylase
MNAHLPAWLEDALFYQVYPQSYFDSNADGIGDLPGLIQKLDYIQDLGVNALWLNPCFVSPFEDAGYDVADYYRIAPRYGSNADAARLFKEAHRRGIKVLLDLVPGHSSWKHPWFQASAKHERNRYSDWYLWTHGTWQGGGPGLDTVRGLFERDAAFVTNFFASQPAFNFGFAKPDPKQAWQQSWKDPKLKPQKEELRKIMRFWLQLGADGFRVDMAHNMVKNDPGKKATMAWWRGLLKGMEKEFPAAALVAEWGRPSQALRSGFDMDFMMHFNTEGYKSLFKRGERSFFHPSGLGNSREFWADYAEQRRGTVGKGHVCIPSGNHDTERMAFGRSHADLEVCFAFLLSMPGAPFIYYGDEIGMRFFPGMRSKEGGYGRTGSRTPMQWAPGKNAGFSKAAPSKLYLPVDPSPDAPTVAAQAGTAGSLLETVRALAKLRHATPALQASGRIQVVQAGSGKEPMVFLRSLGKQRVLVCLHPYGKPGRLRLELAGTIQPAALLGSGMALRRVGRQMEIMAKGRAWGMFKI